MKCYKCKKELKVKKDLESGNYQHAWARYRLCKKGKIIQENMFCCDSCVIAHNTTDFSSKLELQANI